MELDLADCVELKQPQKSWKLTELVQELRTISEFENEFNFSILIEQSPSEKTYTYTCKVLAIILKHNKDIRTIHYDEIERHGLNYIEIKKKRGQKIGVHTPSFIDCNSTIKVFKEHEYIEFNIRLPNKLDMKAVDMIRKKYNIKVPYKFKSEALHFTEV